MSDNLKISLCIFLTLSLGFLSGFSTSSAITGWYTTLIKPFFQPPNWLFGPVWSILYIMIGLSIGLIWTKVEVSKAKSNAIKVFIFQLFLNLIWSPVFFGLKMLLPAAVIIIILWFFIFITIRMFSGLHKIAGKLLIPYLLWVSFATCLNVAIAILN